MESQFHLGDDLKRLERALQELAPAPARLDIAQTMYRAGQASMRPAGRRQYFWPGTSLLLAVVSLALGTLLAMPEQPQIVYVPMDAGSDGGQFPQPALVAESKNAASDNKSSAVSTTQPAENEHSDRRWSNPLSHFRSRDLAMVNLWEINSTTSHGAQSVAIPPLCSGDWRTMVGNNGAGPLSREPDSLLPSDWKHFLHIRGS